MSVQTLYILGCFALAVVHLLAAKEANKSGHLAAAGMWLLLAIVGVMK